MPTGLKQSSSVVSIGFNATETAANTFTQSSVDLNLSPLDREVFVVLAINLDPFSPDSIAATTTAVRSSLTTTSQTAVQEISSSNCLANATNLIRMTPVIGVDGAAFQTTGLETPPATLEYIGIIATPLVPLPPKVKAPLMSGLEEVQQMQRDAYFGVVRDLADVVLPANVAREVINNPNVLMDSNGSISQIPARPGKATSKPRRTRTKVSSKMKKSRKIQSEAFKNANQKARLKNGSFRKGWDQSRLARLAQKECTKERQRLGLCEKPKRKSRKKMK